jgi:hypothetical protein
MAQFKVISWNLVEGLRGITDYLSHYPGRDLNWLLLED